MRVLTVNTGSSTLKWALLEAADRSTVATGTEEWLAGPIEQRSEQILEVLRRIGRFAWVGHRIVHGGTRFTAATVIDSTVRAELEALTALDELHMRPALAAIDAVNAECPEVPQIAAFDTAFHATLPEAAAGYGLPFEWTERWGIRRFGFHGLSVQYSVAAARRLLGRAARKLVVCHLGSGCSVTAVANGSSVDTTMGFSPLEGVMMATRSGSVDPGALLYLQMCCGVDVEELQDALANRSGLLGVSGVSGDLRQVLAAVDTGASRARLAYGRFIWTLRRAVGAMAGVLDGVDALVFTGGIGENCGRVRSDVSAALAFTGLRLATEATGANDCLISATDSRVSVLVIHAREDLVILDEILRQSGHHQSEEA